MNRRYQRFVISSFFLQITRIDNASRLISLLAPSSLFLLSLLANAYIHIRALKKKFRSVVSGIKENDAPCAFRNRYRHER